MKHHYVPAFYLRQWAGNAGTGELCEHKKVYNTVAPRKTSAEGTGYEIDLYRIDGVPAETAQNLEIIFMKLVDTDAHRALVKLRTKPRSPWPGQLRSAWTRFILSLLFRTPEVVRLLKSHIRDLWRIGSEALQEQYAERRKPGDPETFEEYYARTDPHAPHIGAAMMLQQIIDNEHVGPTVFRMIWSRVSVSGSKVPLLTSDRPLDMPLGLGQRNAYIALPIGPYDIFVAAYDPSLARKASDENPTQLVKRMNLATVQRARRFVWGIDDSQLPFIRKHISELPDRVILTEEQLQEARDAARGVIPPGVKLPD